MEVSITLKDWKFEEEGGTRKITGNYVMKCGATEIGVQSFNGSYANVKIPFSSALMVEIEQLTDKIRDEITNNFTGGK